MSGLIVLALRILLVFFLYSFLGWAFFSLWRDIRQQGALLASRKIPPISLSILSGNSAPKMYQFVQSEVTIGRDPICECSVDDEAVSARHARLSFHHNQWWLEDLNSTNGILLNQEKLSMPAVVLSGDEFTCGDTNIGIILNSNELLPSKKKS